MNQTFERTNVIQWVDEAQERFKRYQEAKREALYSAYCLEVKQLNKTITLKRIIAGVYCTLLMGPSSVNTKEDFFKGNLPVHYKDTEAYKSLVIFEKYYLKDYKHLRSMAVFLNDKITKSSSHNNLVEINHYEFNLLHKKYKG